MKEALLVALLASGASPQDVSRPNILWITCEDISPSIRCYGDTYAVTPHIDRLATQGVRYVNAFAPIGVCAPSRSTLIMGMWAPSVGTHHMRCQGTLPAYVKCFPEYLREAGYYCTNNAKTDYNFAPPRTAWDESSGKAHWRNRKKGQPFFSVFNFTSCHESQIRLGEGEYRKRTQDFTPEERHDPAKAPVPPYHPDTPEVRKDWARYADMITYMDREVGRVLKELEEDGLADNTIVFYFSDHGAGMPRSKRWLYDSSLRVPMIVRFPEPHKRWAPGEPGTTTDRLVTFVDYAPTVLNLAGVKIPAHLQGQPFLGGGTPREYVFGFRDRMDERYDMLRTARDKRYRYIRNYMPHHEYAQHISYMYQMPTMKAWQRLHDEGKLVGPQKFFFDRKPPEELYDSASDPHEVKNLAADPAHRETLERMRRALRAWMVEIVDLGFLPEADLRARFGGKAPHEAVRADKSLYPLERLIDAASEPSLDLLKDPDAAMRYWGAMSAGEQARPELKKALEDPSATVQVAAADALSRMGLFEDAIPVLGRALKHDSEWVRLHAINVIDRLDGKANSLASDVRGLEQDKNEYVRRVVAHALEGLPR